MKYILIVLVFFSSISIAGDWSTETEVNQIYSGYKNGMILFNTTSPIHSPNPECNNGIYSVEPVNADVNHVLSILLAAQRSGAKINVGVSSTICSSDGNKYTAVSRIKINK